jgi:uncharacterized protein (DUF2062 family)
MIFKRRTRPGMLRRLREALNPRKGWRRGFEYIGRRVQRLPDTPHRIALGVSCGVLASFTPFFTLHIFVAVALALAARANAVAAALGTLFGNPLTFPLIATTALAMGGWLLGESHAAEAGGLDVGAVFGDLRGFFDTLFLPYLVGGLCPGVVVAGVVYLLLRPLVAAYQARRRGRLVAAAGARVAAGLAHRRVKKNPVPEGLE